MTRALFPVAAAFNLAVGAPLLLAPVPVYRLVGMAVPTSLLEARLVGLFVMLFGALYWIIGQRDGHDAPLLMVGIAGKAGAFLLTVGHWLAGEASGLFALLGCVDLIFGALFLGVLLRATARRPETT